MDVAIDIWGGLLEAVALGAVTAVGFGLRLRDFKVLAYQTGWSIWTRDEEMCHIEADVEISDCDLLFLVLFSCCFVVCAHDSSGICGRVSRLFYQQFFERFGVLAVKRPVGCCCNLISRDVGGWESWVDEVS